MNVVIVLPTYNEKGNIEKLITILEKEVFPHIKNHEMSILVADDNSPDGTADEVRKLMKQYSNIGLNMGEKQGLGAAYIRAMTYAVDKMHAEVLFEMDADLMHDPHKVPEFLKKIDEGYDIVVGTRYSDGGSMPPEWKIHRKIFSVTANFLVRGILMRFWIHDWTGGFRALKKEVFLKEKNKLLQYSGYTFQVAFLHQAMQDGFKVGEVPFLARDRTLGRSKIAPLEYIVNLFKYVIVARFWELVHSPFLKYGVTGFVGYIINAVAIEIFRQYVGLPSVWSAFIAAELSIVWNFNVNNFWAFSSQKIDNPLKLLLKFVQFNLVSAGSVGIITLSIYFSTEIFADTIFVRQITLPLAVGFLVIPYSYSMYNIFIWKRWHIPFLARLQKMAG